MCLLSNVLSYFEVVPWHSA